MEQIEINNDNSLLYKISYEYLCELCKSLYEDKNKITSNKEDIQFIDIESFNINFKFGEDEVVYGGKNNKFGNNNTLKIILIIFIGITVGIIIVFIVIVCSIYNKRRYEIIKN